MLENPPVAANFQPFLGDLSTGTRGCPRILFEMKKPRPSHLLALGVLVIGLSVAFAAGLSNYNAYRYLNVFQEVWAMTRGNYVEDVNETALLMGAYEGMAASLDATSGYLSPGKEKLLDAPPGPGVAGMEILPAGGVPIVVRVDPGGPADKAGLEPGDQIWRIDGQSARKFCWPLLNRMVRGRVGSGIELTVLDGSTFKVKQTKLILEKPPAKTYELEIQDGPVVYLRLRDLSLLDTGALKHDLAKAMSTHPGAPLLLDLRGVVGTDPQPVVRLAGLLFPGGPLLKLRSRKGPDDTVAAPETPRPLLPEKSFGLVDGTTAGMGEALALLFKERQGAQLGGRPTFGMGGIPEQIPLSQGGTLLLSTREIRTVAGTAWANKGFEPGKILTPSSTGARLQDDPLLVEALRWVREEASLKPAA